MATTQLGTRLRLSTRSFTASQCSFSKMRLAATFTTSRFRDLTDDHAVLIRITQPSQTDRWVSSVRTRRVSPAEFHYKPEEASLPANPAGVRTVQSNLGSIRYDVRRLPVAGIGGGPCLCQCTDLDRPRPIGWNTVCFRFHLQLANNITVALEVFRRDADKGGD